MVCYKRAVFYYETDQMGVVHHSNYIRWLEEARSDFLRVIGLPYEVMEAAGVLSPVLALDVRYLHAARFGQTVRVYPRMRDYTGVRFSFAYQIYNENNLLLLEGTTKHAFVSSAFKPLSLRKVSPEMDALLRQYIE